MVTFFLVPVKLGTEGESSVLRVLRADGIVPLTMKGISDEVEGAQLRIRHENACRIALAILDGSNVQSFVGGGMRDQLNDRFQRRGRFGPPVDGDAGKEPMFDLVPRARWQEDNGRR